MSHTILVVEDERNLRRLYKEELEALGYNVLCAAGGKEAVRKVAEEPIDLVVLDIAMPDMDGLEAMQKMLDKNRKLPVILNTAYASYKDDFSSWSAEAYIIKSPDLTELINEVDAALKRVHAREKSAREDRGA
ncbi:MAG: response regulator [Armatimonadota bacterium]